MRFSTLLIPVAAARVARGVRRRLDGVRRDHRDLCRTDHHRDRSRPVPTRVQRGERRRPARLHRSSRRSSCPQRCRRSWSSPMSPKAPAPRPADGDTVVVRYVGRRSEDAGVRQQPRGGVPPPVTFGVGQAIEGCKVMINWRRRSVDPAEMALWRSTAEYRRHPARRRGASSSMSSRRLEGRPADAPEITIRRCRTRTGQKSTDPHRRPGCRSSRARPWPCSRWHSACDGKLLDLSWKQAHLPPFFLAQVSCPRFEAVEVRRSAATARSRSVADAFGVLAGMDLSAPASTISSWCSIVGAY